MRTHETNLPQSKVDLAEIRLEDIEANPAQPRTDFDSRLLEQLATSLSNHKLLQPIGVCRSPGDSVAPFRLLWGERRLRAAQLAGWETITARVLDVTPAEGIRILGAENLNRHDWNPIEKAAYVATLTTPESHGGAGMTTNQIAKYLGHTKSWVFYLKQLNKLPDDWKRRIISSRLNISKSYVLCHFLKRPHVLAAIGEDFDKHPDRWRTMADFSKWSAFIASQLDAFEGAPHQELVRGQGEPDQRKPREQSDEVRQCCEQSESDESATSPQKRRTVRPDDIGQYFDLIEPYRENLPALLAIRDLVQMLIDQLEDAKASRNGKSRNSKKKAVEMAGISEET